MHIAIFQLIVCAVCVWPWLTTEGAAPAFDSGSYSGSVNENVATDTTVSGIAISATDADNDSISYSIISSAGPFKLSGDGSAVLTNGLTIDHESQDSYTLTVQAEAAGNTTTVSVTITINDVNEAPSFTLSSYSGVIAENSANGVDVITITTTDPDSGDTLTYSLSGSGSSLFAVLSNGVIEVDGSLDFESTASYSLTLTATDSGSLTDTTAVVISISDVNESPSFVSAPYSATVAENDAAASVVTVAATDPDSVSGNTTVTFSLSGEKSSDFSVHASSGVVTLSSALNYESVSSYSLTVTASDGNSGMTSTSLSITVTNNNDAPVSLSGSYSASVAEDEVSGTSVLQTSATDEDGHSILYTISGSSDFQIMNSGMITVASGASLDFETTNSYNLTVTFSDGSASVSQFVAITVTDKNDAPTLLSSPYSASVSEDASVGFSVLDVNASDDDGDSLTFSLSGAGASQFAIDSSTGEVTVSEILDYEDSTSHSMTVHVSDGNGGRASASLTITVMDANDDPEFLGAPYTTTIDEGLINGTTLFAASAIDDDSGDTLTYSLSGTNNAHFSISSSSGVISTAQSLDYEQVTLYSLTVSVSDGTTTITTSLGITVNNRNDEPAFTDAPYSAVVNENDAGAAVYTVSASDDDTADTLSFFLAGSGSADFVLDSSTGAVTLARALDFEATSFYFLKVLVLDGNGGSATSNLNVTVSDLNDAPVFLSTPYSASISETLATGTNVIQVTASDEDSGDTLSYSLNGTNNDHFAISSTGLVTTSQELDKETAGSYSLDVIVNDGTTSVTEALSITVIDMNDAPTFSDAPYAASVAEGDIGSSVVTVSAVDQDSGDTVTFTLSGTGSVDFSLNPSTGVVTLTRALDYETTPIYYLTVRASDSNGGVATTSLNVTVTDQNDSPQFSSTPYSVNIGENLPVGTTVITIVASDQDPSDTLTFSLSGTSNDHFSIGSNTGVISTAQVLDRENINSYSLNVSVSDGSVTVIEGITIGVNNNNDAPAFSSAPYNVSVNENVNSGNIFTVTATDDDSDAITFTLYGFGSQLFSIHASSGVVSLVEALDYESDSGYTLTVRASDSNGAVTTTSLYIDVVDQNDDPSFSGTPYSSSVSEDVAVGSTVLVVTAADQDGDSLTFTLSGSSHFSIGSATGVITTAQALDFESISSYSLAVNVSDGTTTVTQPLTISTRDVNDAPSFTGAPYTVSVNENEVGGAIFTVSATDDDSDTVTFLLSGAGSADFSIHSTSGAVSLSHALDYESLSSYLLTVTASDTNGGMAQTTLNVTVVDQNDDPSFVGAPFSTQVDENLVSGSTVLKLTATDQDTGDSLTFSIAGTNSGHFAISSSGLITTTQALDYESINSYSLNVSVSDGTSTVSEAITISVRDTNDAPTFSNAPYTATVAENNSSAAVYTVTATDEDSGDTLTFYLSGEGSGDFSIHSSTGLVFLSNSLNYERKSSYVLSVIVRDENGGEATTTLTVTVSDQNESPSFIGTPYSVTLDEDVSVGTTVLRASAVDEDSADNLTYSLSGTNNSHFSIASNTGIITTALSLDYETLNSYSLTATVTDGTASDSQAVSISVNNKNDVPVFVSAPYSVSVPENTTASTLLTVTATDQDTADTLNFLLLGTGHELFSIHLTSGVVSLIGSLDYEVNSLYTLTVRVSDSNGGVATTSLTVTVSDVNDSPQFLGTPYSATLSENLASGSDVIQVAAIDADGDSLSFSLSGTNSSHFQISSSTGLIESAQQLDYETLNSYSLTVSVSDGTVNISTSLTISVADSNDAPYVTNLPANVSLDENDVTLSVIDVDADDPDADNLTFTLTGTGSDDFVINSATGLITLNSGLNYEAQAQYSLSVRVGDGLGGVAVASLTVTVVNQNDPPVMLGTPYTASVEEGLNSGTSVYNVAVTDEDSADTISYTLSGTNSSHFTISSAGIITTTQALDYESLVSYTLIISAQDGSDSVNTTLTVTVVDVNDSPQFTSAPYTVSVNENDASAAVYNVTAVDVDSGPADTLSYSLYGAGCNIFSIHSSTGVVTLTEALDYEQAPQYILTVQVTDGRGGLDTTSLTVNVNNENDDPVFQGTPFSSTVLENVPVGTSVLQISASDQDTNDTLTYTLSGANSSHFQISSSTGLILTAQELDYEVLNYFSLTASVSDGSTTVSQPLTISVQDANDFPLLAGAPYSVQIVENDVAASVCTVNATDPDNDTLYFSLSGSGSAHFTIHSSTGEVSLVQALDFESTAVYVLSVHVSDGQGGVNTSSLNVEVTDQNDAPSFVNTPFSASIDENIDIGSQVIQASATDQDTNDTLAYSLSGANSSDFAISITGVISTAGEIDFETTYSYSLTVSVSDGTTTVTTPLTVSVNNLNDPPAFQNSPYNSTVDENTAASVSVLQVSATDQDGNSVVFSFIGITSSDFTVNAANGVISTAVNLDYEKTPSYVLTVQADDSNGRKTITSVIITVTDLNDEEPTFNSASYNGHVTENIAIGSSVMTVTASDGDTADSSLAYALSGTNSSHFNVTSNGLIQTTNDIDYEIVQSYSLTLTATDRANNTGTTTLIIAVINVIDNGPVFSDASYSAVIAEDSGPGTSVVRITATDADLGDVITYSLSGADSSEFTVSETTGVISTNALLDRESQDFFTFTITATDSGSLYSLATVNVTVSDVNDNSPVCAQAVYAGSVTEDAATGTSVMNVSCPDLDIGTNAQVTYSIVSGDGGHFVVNSSTGVLSTSASLDLESTEEYVITVQASDGGSTPLSTTTTVSITITGVNEHTPQFLPNDTYSVTLAESLALGHDVITVSANDADAGNQGQVTYAITRGDTYGNFVIDSKSGVIELVASLDYETTPLISLKVTATDGDSGSPLTSQATVTVNVVDVNDNYPQCLPGLLTPAVLESAAVGDVVVTLNCSDHDNGSFAQLSYTFSGGNSDGKFNISISGTVSLADTLDYETDTSYSLSITVTDGGVPALSTVVSLKVSVSPVNEYSPVFTSNGAYSVTVPEDTSLGTELIRVTANDGDLSGHAHGRVVYSITSGNTGFFFHISADTGAIQLMKSLDREANSNYTLVVEATDGENPVNATVSITVSDSNDNEPSCSPSSYSASVREDVSLGTSVLSVTCSDDDEGNNGLLVYSITSGNSNSSFTIDSNGTISTAASLDYETTPSFTLTVKARDSSSPTSSQLFVVMDISIDVTSVNEHEPVFDSPQYSTSIDEDTTVGTSVLRITATDQDEGLQGEVRYSLTPLDAPFYIDTNTGVIRVKTSLDRESLANYSLIVTAHDRDPNSADIKSSSVNVTIVLNDVNDNDPLFSPDHYQVEFFENTTVGTNITRLQCSDQDLDTNSALVYSITDGDPSSYFSVSSSTGQITAAKQLDFEDAQSYSLTVEARDSSSPISSRRASLSHVDVIVAPLNEHTPGFRQSSYNVTVSENTTIGSIIVTIAANDSDQGSQGELTFSLSSGSPFYIDRVSGALILKQALDYEDVTSYLLTVTATDGDVVSPKSSSVNVTVMLRDENDNAPTFTPTVYSVTIAENTSVGTAILNLTCADADSGSNGLFVMVITSGNTGTGFSITDEGVLSVASTLDVETTQLYSLEITATDRNPTQPLSRVAQVSVTITDVNEHTPQFTSGGSYTAMVAENTTIGSVVSNVTATDLDISSAVTYTITSGNSDDMFFIRPSDGAVFVKRPLNRETVDSYSLTIEASDQDVNSPLSSQASLILTITDINDNPPVCDPTVHGVSLAESVAIATTVVQLNCTDADIAPNIVSSYVMTTGNTTVFDVDASGLVTTLTSLDYESVKSYLLVVTASDGGSPQFSTEVAVSVQVTGTNEFSPVFVNASYAVSHSEDTAVGSVITTVAATDDDHGSDGIIVYSIIDGNSEGRFQVDSDSGAIELRKFLDRETTAAYSLTVQATDQGSPNMSSTATVNITVLDINDNTPLCNHSSYIIEVAENVTINSTIVRLYCSDADEGQNSDVSFNISSGNTNATFSVNSSSGVVSLIGSLNRESLTYYDLLITVSDGGSTQLSSQVTVYVIVTAVNEFTPTFTQNGFYNASLTEDTPVSTTLVTVQALDGDSGDQGRVTYSITGGNSDGSFLLDKDDGVLVLRKQLDHEAQSQYSLTVLASDNAPAPHTKWSLATVNITVLDLNDNAPSCSLQAQVVPVLESVIVGTVLFSANCTDPDSDSQLTYEITQGNNDSKFNVSSSGEVVLAEPLNIEEKSLFSLLLTVFDSGSPVKNSNISLTINVLAVNEYAPTFVDNNALYQIDILENITLGTVVFQAQVNDNDTGLHGALRYILVSGNEEDKFYLNEVLGRLVLVSGLDRETCDQYNITLRVEDSTLGSPEVKHSNVTVFISVNDVNDNSPVCSPSLYTVEITEALSVGANVTSVTCSDEDLGPNGEFTFVIASGNTGNKFGFDNNTIIVNGSLDHESESEYSLEVHVTDQGVPSHVTVVLVTIYVRAENEFTPVFQFSNYSVNISEAAVIGSEVFDANATDLDTGVHGQLEYLISGGLSGGIDFTMDHQTGHVYVGAQLDRETRDLYVLNLTVKDRAQSENERRSTMMELTVYILDENDNPPVFTEEIYTATIPENVATGYPVIRVNTTDADLAMNALHSFTITGGDGVGQFNINSTSGEITARAGLDRETKDTYYLSITAQDSGNLPLTAVCGVRVFISDTNDNKPVFSPTVYLTSISEATSPGTDVIPVYASDVDLSVNQEIEFSVVGGDVKEQFQVNSVGMISTNKSLDREDIPFYTLLIQASDKGNPTLTETVSVNVTILDINDNSPVFSNFAFSVSVPENLPLSSRFLNVTASDADAEDNGLLTFSIFSGNTGNVMAIDSSTGTLYNVGSFDRETIPEYFLTVKAVDAGIPSLTNSTIVHVRIYDSNDNTPTFNDADFSFIIIENQPIGTSVGTIQATDRDNGTHAQLVYSIMSGDNKDDFSINPSQGIIYTTVQLDRETVPEYRITVKVSDSAAFPDELSNTTKVYITVLDQNDNNPIFGLSHYNASIDENSPSGTPVTTVTATDSDRDANAQLTYSITQSSSVEYFRIDSSTGEVFVKNVFDYEAVKVVNVTVTAQDGGITRLSGAVSLSIYINDVNDNSPTFDEDFYEATIRVDLDIDSAPAFLTAAATDRDSGEFGTVQFELQEESEFFDLGTNTGGIRLKATPPSGQIYTLRVRAKDKGSPPLTSDYVPVLVDTVDPVQTLVDIELDISQEEFEANRELFEAELSRILGAEIRIENVLSLEEQTRRKKRATNTGIRITIYAVTNPLGNNTNLNDKLSQVNQYLTRDEILKLLQDEDGNPSVAVTNNTALEVFKIRTVKATKPTDPPPTTAPPPTPFLETTEGIVTLAFAGLALLLVVVAVVMWRKHAKKRVRLLESREPHLRPNRGLAEGEYAVYKSKANHNKMVSPMMTDHQIYAPNGKTFDGKAMDPVTGKVYLFNKTTRERMWLQDLREDRNRPQSLYGNRNTQSRLGDSHHKVHDSLPPRASLEIVHERGNRGKGSHAQLPGTPEGR